MSYRVNVVSPVRRQIANWGLPDFLIAEIYLRLRDELGQDPPRYLRRTRRPFDGMTYRFSLVDPDNRLCEHICTFPVMYSPDEETLIVVGFAYERRVGT